MYVTIVTVTLLLLLLFRLKYIDDKMAELKGANKDERQLTEYVMVTVYIHC